MTKQYPGSAAPAVEDFSLTIPAGEIVVFVASVLFIGNLFGFIEEAIDVLFAFRRKTMQPRQHQLFLELDHAFRELTVFRLQRRNARHQLLNSGVAGSDHPILESEPFRPVNRRR